MDKQGVVEKIIELVGSEGNINSVSHCFTRLRLKLNDRTIVNDDALNEIPAVMGLYDRGGELQVIMGNKVSEYYQEAEKLLQGKTAGAVDEKLDDEPVQKQKMSIIDKIADVSSGIFVPIIGVLAGCGTLQGLISLLTFTNVISTDGGTYMVLYAIGQGIFYFFPFFLAFTAAQKFGGKPAIALAVAAAMMYPSIMTAAQEGASLSFVGIPLMLREYSSTVFPIIVATWLASVVEKQMRKIIPDIIKMIFVPMCTLLIVVPITLLVVGPVLTYVMSAITSFVTFLFDFSPILAGTLTGGMWQLLVFLGISKAFMPIFTSEFMTQGYSYFGAVTFFVAAMGQTGAVFAIAAKTKIRNIKAVTFGAGVSGLFGITEPALFGVNVPAKKPFLFGSLSAAAGGLIASVFGGKLYSLATGVLGVPSLINPETGIDQGFFAVIIGSVITFVLAFALTYKFGWTAENEEEYKLKM